MQPGRRPSSDRSTAKLPTLTLNPGSLDQGRPPHISCRRSCAHHKTCHDVSFVTDIACQRVSLCLRQATPPPHTYTLPPMVVSTQLTAEFMLLADSFTSATKAPPNPRVICPFRSGDVRINEWRAHFPKKASPQPSCCGQN